MPHPEPPPSPRNWRPLLFAAVCLAALAAVLGYARFSRRHAESLRPTTVISTDPRLLAAIRSRPHLVFRSTALESSGRIAIVPLDAPTIARALAPLACERVHATRDSGLCLSASRGVFTRYEAQVFDGDFRVVSRFPLAGAPSRARVSANGALGVSTVFVAGDSVLDRRLLDADDAVRSAEGAGAGRPRELRGRARRSALLETGLQLLGSDIHE